MISITSNAEVTCQTVLDSCVLYSKELEKLNELEKSQRLKLEDLSIKQTDIIKHQDEYINDLKIQVNNSMFIHIGTGILTGLAIGYLFLKRN